MSHNLLHRLDFLEISFPVPTVCRIAISVSQTCNALGPQVVVELIAQLTSALLDNRVRAILLTGKDEFFCTGDHYSKVRDLSGNQLSSYVQSNQTLAKLVYQAAKPIIAAVDGLASAGGIGLALACDYVVIGPATRFSFPYAKDGLPPDFGILHSMTQRMGSVRTRKIVLESSLLTASQIIDMNLADKIVEDGKLGAESIIVAETFGDLPASNFRVLKAAFRECYTFDQDLAYEFAARVRSC